MAKDFRSLPNPQIPWKRRTPHLNYQGNLSLKFTRDMKKRKGRMGAEIV